jgi:hypothetical protein
MVIDEHHPDQFAIFLVATSQILDSLCGDASFVRLPQGYSSSVVSEQYYIFFTLWVKTAQSKSKLSQTLTKYAYFRYSRDGRPYIHELDVTVQVWKGIRFYGDVPG